VFVSIEVDVCGIRKSLASVSRSRSVLVVCWITTFGDSSSLLRNTSVVPLFSSEGEVYVIEEAVVTSRLLVFASVTVKKIT